MTDPALLRIHDLRTYFYARGKRALVRSVDGVDLEVKRGETLGIVGESGSGKSITLLSALGLISAGPGVISGSIVFNDGTPRDLLAELDRYVTREERNGRIMTVSKDNTRWRRQVEANMRGIRGGRISMIFQNPKAAMNPFETVGEQIAEMVRMHTGVRARAEVRERVLYWLEQVKIDSPNLRFHNYPYGLSGGMCQRAMIAMALSSEPAMLIADEPTTGLDATIQSRIVDLMAELKLRLSMTLVLISHDIGIVARLADRVAVMYGGRVMESGPASTVLAARAGEGHPYTRALLASTPHADNVRDKGRLPAIEGEVLDTINIPRGCRFYARCQQVHAGIRERCSTQEPGLIEVASAHAVRCWRYAE
jgi:peptide/nickel transport system ATP-binding protein